MPGVLTYGGEDTTETRIKVAELADRERRMRAEVDQHDGKIETLQQAVARVEAQMYSLYRLVAWFGGAIGTAAVGACAAALAKLFGG